MVVLMLSLTLLYWVVSVFSVALTAVSALAMVPVLAFRKPLFRLVMLVITPVVFPSPTIMVCTDLVLSVSAVLSFALSISSLPVSGSVVIPIFDREVMVPEPDAAPSADFRRVWMVRNALSPSK